MFDELEEVKYFKEIIDFKSLKMYNDFKEQKVWRSLQKAEAHLKTKRVSTMELFVNILTGLLFSVTAYLS